MPIETARAEDTLDNQADLWIRPTGLVAGIRIVVPRGTTIMFSEGNGVGREYSLPQSLWATVAYIGPCGAGCSMAMAKLANRQLA